MKELIPQEIIERKIYLIGGHKVMLDGDLAKLYGVATKVLIQAVKRNIMRFPSDFMFQLNKEEFLNLRSQFVTSSWGGRRYLPYAFTEQGVAMLSSVLKSERAIQVNIVIMRAFVNLRAIIATHKELARKLSELEKKITRHDAEIEAIFDAIRMLTKPPEKSKKRIGFIKMNRMPVSLRGRSPRQSHVTSIPSLLEVVANCDHLHVLKYSPVLPYAFTEHGAVMLATVLNSTIAYGAGTCQKGRSWVRSLAGNCNGSGIIQTTDRENAWDTKPHSRSLIGARCTSRLNVALNTMSYSGGTGANTVP